MNSRVTLRKSQRVVPENKTYASATKYTKKIVVIGDSHLKRIKQNLFKNSFDDDKSFITLNMKHYVIPSLKEQKRDIIAIHIRGNDINYKNKDNVNVNELVNNINSPAMTCRDFGIPDAAISEALPKKNIAVTAFIRKVNDQVRELCKNNKFILFLIDILPEISYIMMESI